MIDTSNFALFIVTSIVVILMPGPAMLFIISNGFTGGPKASISWHSMSKLKGCGSYETSLNYWKYRYSALPALILSDFWEI